MDTTTPNPFEPPRTTDLDGGQVAAMRPRLVSDEALDELADAAPWVRRLSRVTALSIAVQLFSVIALVRRFGSAYTVGAVRIAVVGMTIAALFLFVFRRYAAASERFRDGDDDAIGPLLATQALYFRLAGVVTVIGTALFIVWLAVGIASGRWLSWVRA